MKIFNLVKSEFLKNYSLKKMIVIILIVSLFSIGLVEFTNLFYPAPSNSNKYWNVSDIEYLNELSKKENRTLEEDYTLYELKLTDEIHKYFNDKRINGTVDWRYDMANDIRLDLLDNYLFKLISDKSDDPLISEVCSNENYKPTVYGDGYASSFLGRLAFNCDYYRDGSLNSRIEENDKEIETYKKILKEDKFYLYLQYLIDIQQIFDNDIDMAKIIIDKKIEDMWDYRALNYIMYSQWYIDLTILSESEFYEAHEIAYPSYKDYVRYNKTYNKEAKKAKAILKYSTEHEIKNDLTYSSFWKFGRWQDSYDYVTSKKMVNQVFHLTIIVLIVVCITSSNIISGEHNKGTIKNIITTPVKRYKILLSKFIYLILHTYIIWLIGLVALSVYAGIKFGFSDLFTPKLIYSGGKVLEVNYYLFLLKDMFLASIPVIAFLSILFFLSTVTLNTALTTSVMTILSVIPAIIYFVCSHLNINLNFLVYTPFPYFDCGFIFNNHEFYINILKKVAMNLNLGIVVSLITIVVLFTITNLIYMKRDIKS